MFLCNMVELVLRQNNNSANKVNLFLHGYIVHHLPFLVFSEQLHTFN